MLKVIIIGSGNVAQHLIRSLSVIKDVQLVQAFARDPKSLLNLLPSEKITGSLTSLKDADIYVIAISDDAIAEVSQKIPYTGKLVVHTSGSTSLTSLNDKNRRGVFYPLQTLSKNKHIDFNTIPICLETEFDSDYAVLDKLAKYLSFKVYAINSEQRQSLHVSAVFVSNFVNHMYAIGNSICIDNNVPFDVLSPLIQETAGKINSLTPIQAQTGPAVRNDVKTLKKHIDFLKDENQKAIYKLLTKSIQKTHE